MGLIPFFQDILIDPEGSVVIQEDRGILKPIGPSGVNIGALGLPAISNFTDLEALTIEQDVVLNYLFYPDDLEEGYDFLDPPRYQEYD
nr:hypothetical protein [Desulfobacterales bacterium]